MGIDFNKLNPEEATKIINALKDGKINDKEAKELKLTAQEQEALNNAFSSGEVRIGDFVLVNKGKSEDGKMQYSETKQAPKDTPAEDEGFFTKAWNRVKSDVKGYADNFTQAWNKSDGFIKTAVSLSQAADKTLAEFVEDQAEYTENVVGEVAGEKVGKFVRSVTPQGLADGVNKAFDGNYDNIKETGKNVLAVGLAPLTLLSSCSENIDIDQNVTINITPDSSLKEAIDAFLMGQELTNELLGKILEREIQNGMTAEEILKLVGQNNDLLYRILDSITAGNALLKEIQGTVKEGNEEVLDAIITVKNSIDVLTELVAEYPDYSNEFKKIIEAIEKGNASITDVKNLINKVINQLVNNGDVQKDILAKLEEIQNSNESDGVKLAEMLKLLGEINVKIDGIAANLKTHFENDAKVNAYLEQILKEAKKNNETTKETNALLKDLYALVESLGKRGDELGKQILEYIAAVGFEMNRNFTALIAAVKEGKVDLTEITDLLKQLNEKVDTNGKKGEELGKQILNYIAAFGFETNQNFKKVIEAIGKDGAKLDSINALLAVINENIEKNGEDAKKMGDQILNYIVAFGFETNQNFKKVLEAINAQGAGSTEIKDMLQKVLDQLDKMDKNQQASAKAIIDAIANIKISGGGAADLSTVEKMLAELLEVAKGNNKVLNSIDIKMDALNITTKSIEAKLDKEFGKNDERYKNVMNILTVIENKVGNGSGIDEAKLFEKLDKLANKLDDILAAIKDHKVTVDITGKVTCECNCGNSHEGILGDLEDILK